MLRITPFLSSNNGIQDHVQVRHGLVHVLQLIQPEQPEPKRLKIARLRKRVHHEGHARRNLHTRGRKLRAGLHPHVFGVRHDDGGRLEPGRGDGLDAALLQRAPDGGAQRLLLGLHVFEAAGLGLELALAEGNECVGGHGAKVGVAAVFVRLHDVVPLLEVDGERLPAVARLERLLRAGGEHDEARASGAGPALLGGCDEDVDAEGVHVSPEAPRGDAVEDEDCADFVGGVGDGLDVVVGDEDAGGGVDLGGEDAGGFFGFDGGDDVFDEGGPVGRVGGVVDGEGGDGDFGGDEAGAGEDVGPAVGEVAVADDERLLVGAEGAGRGLHRVGAGAREDNGGGAAIHFFQGPADVVECVLELLRHVVQRAVRVDHRELQQPVLGIRARLQRSKRTSRHGFFLRGGCRGCGGGCGGEEGRGGECGGGEGEEGRARGGAGGRSGARSLGDGAGEECGEGGRAARGGGAAEKGG
mmetsp:Transcript_23734/g.58994  ORF Transcript_23734/g.58994 Transcript_23734/m.58994 type:complete len:469 (+) Transcript_23734:276-1682(+)